MKRFFFLLLALISAGLFVRVAYLVLASPPDPAFNAPNHEAIVDHLNHLFRQAAYSITWAIQLGYLAWLGLKWRAEKQMDGRRKN
ncbi:MAG TPA: hypothetical protein VMU71_11435 [Terracidiphilus sp.]|nr:hypothetical protein [Terracidiphilus sp.]